MTSPQRNLIGLSRIGLVSVSLKDNYSRSFARARSPRTFLRSLKVTPEIQQLSSVHYGPFPDVY